MGTPPAASTALDHLPDAAARRQHVVDDEHALARVDDEAAQKASSFVDGLSEDATQPSCRATSKRG